MFSDAKITVFNHLGIDKKSQIISKILIVTSTTINPTSVNKPT